MWRPLLLVSLSGLFACTRAAAQPPVVPGFPNVAQTAGALLSGLNAPEQGRTAIIAYHNGILYTVPEVPSSQPGADFQVRSWNIADPANPVVTGVFGITPMPVNAHGYFAAGDYLVLGANWPLEAPWSFRATTPGVNVRTSYPGLLCAGVRGCMFEPWFVDQTFWSYNEVSGNARLLRNWVELAQWDHLGATGVIGHPFLLGDLLVFLSDQSRTGVATYDVSDPGNPVLLDVLTTGGPGGYWPELWSGGGRLYAIFPYQTDGNGFRVVDLTDPADLRFVTDRPLPGAAAMYAQFQDEYGFIGDHKIDLRTFESVLFLDGATRLRPTDGQTGVDTSQFALPLGNLLVTGGIGEDEGMAIWAHQATPDTRGPEVTYHIPQAGRTSYPPGLPISLLIHETLETKTLVNGTTFIVRPLGGSALAGRLVYSFDDVLTFTPDAPLAANTTFEVVVPAGGIKDAAGNGIVGHAFSFSTGASVAGNQPPQVTAFAAADYPVEPGNTTTLSASATDPNGGVLEYRFDRGDGSAQTAWSLSTQASATYTTPGHYRATVQVRDAQNAIASRSLVITVTDPPSGPAPTRSSPVVCDQETRRVFVVNPDSSTVSVVDADASTLELEVPACADPRSLALAPTGELWVACRDDDRVVVLDAGSGAVRDTLELGYGSAPAGVAVDPAGARVFVTLEGRGELRRFDAATRQETGSVALGERPRALAVSADGCCLLVTRFLSPADWGEIWEVDSQSLAVLRTMRLAKLGGDLNRDSTAGGRGTPNHLAGITASRDGTRAWVTATKPNAERGTLFGPDLDSDNPVRSVLLEIDLGSGAVARAIDLDNSDSPSAVALSPLGDYLLVTLQGNDQVIVLDALSAGQSAGLGDLVGRLGTGAAPQGLCVDAESGRTLVHNLMGRSVTVLSTDALFRTGALGAGSLEVATVDAEPLLAEVAAGKRLFYAASDPRMSAEGYLSCATCHLDGDHDGRTWDFTGRGEGLRNTAVLRGRAGVLHGNVHWSANFDEIQDFENDIRGAFGGRGFRTVSQFAATEHPLGAPKAGLSTDLDALAAYVASLAHGSLGRSPWRNPDGSMTASALAGRAVFGTAGCAQCHGGAEFTDSTGPTETLHDVGTLRTTSGERLGGPLPGIDTPTLLGLWATAPYFHDGSAPTLDDVFRVSGGRVLPAEEGSTSFGAQRITQWVDLNYDDTVHGRALVAFDSSGARLTFSGVDGGRGGVGAVEVRYSAYDARTLEVRVNGVLHLLDLPAVGNDPAWRHTNWGRARLEGISLAAGAANTIELRGQQWTNISIDEIVVAHSGDLAAAAPHRAVLGLSATDRADLLAYLRSLDAGSPGGLPAPLFADDFEGGSTSAWDFASP